MKRTHVIAVVFAALMVASLGTPLGVGTTGASADETRLPTDIALNSDDTVETFNETGVARTDVTAPQMEIEVASDRRDLDLPMSGNPLDSSLRNDFIRISHKEDMARTVKIPIRSDYWKPFPRENLESMDESHTADLEPVQESGEKYTMLTVTFDGEGEAVFPIPADAAAVYDTMETTEERTNETFGFDFGLTPTPWEEIDGDVFSENDTTVRIEGEPNELMIQYNAGTSNDPHWIRAPNSQTSTDPYYVMERDGVDNAVYVVSTGEDTPDVRFKERNGFADKVAENVREAKHLPSRVLEGVGIDLCDVPIIGGDCS